MPLFYPPTRTIKRATATTGSPNSLFAVTTGADYMQRIVFMLPVKTIRWRLVVANKNAQDASVPGTGASVTSVYVGTPAFATNGRWNGNCTTALTQAISTPLTVNSSGADATTGWVTATNAQFAAHTQTVLSMAITVNSGGTGVVQSDAQAFTLSGGSALVGSATPASIAAGPWVLDVRMEYEISATTGNLTGFVVGASGESGYTATGDLSDTPVPYLLPYESWPGVMARYMNHNVINGGLGATSTNDWLTVSGRPYTRFDLATTVPDYAIIGMLLSNDVASISDGASAGTITSTLNTIQSNVSTIIANLATLGIRRIYMATVPPRNFTAGQGKELLRQRVNNWIRSFPLGVEGLMEFDKTLRSPTNALVIDPDFVSADNIHPLRAGHIQMGNLAKVRQASIS